MAASPRPLPVFLPERSDLKIEEIHHQGNLMMIAACAVAKAAECPDCGIPSTHVHSRYYRTLRDLPWQGVRVQMRVRARRFYCRTRECQRQIFTERFPMLAYAGGRQTLRHQNILQWIGYALGGEAGLRLAARLGIEASADTILRAVKRVGREKSGPHVRVLGVDDWAWRKGHRYGTILVDLERHQPIDLLPDRESGTLEHWLESNPSVEIISRDRAGAYAEGARQGAPAAVQIADRFHLLCNLTQTLHRILERFAGTLQKLQLPESETASTTSVMTSSMVNVSSPAVANATGTPAFNPQQQQRREKRKEQYEAIKAAQQSGLNKSAIAQQFGVSRTTVRRLLKAEEFPERAPRRRRTALAPFCDYLKKRWEEGCHNASQLCRELRKQGYTGQRSRIKEYVHPWRAEVPAPRKGGATRKLPNLRSVAFWLTKLPEQRKTTEQVWVSVVTGAQPEIATAEKLGKEFRDLFRNRDGDGLDAWLKASDASGIPELKGFAAGIQRDHAAVRAGIIQTWSNGQVEGQVHRLKLLKRQMYGRASFDLLRARVLSLTATAPRSP
jgi:transposase